MVILLVGKGDFASLEGLFAQKLFHISVAVRTRAMASSFGGIRSRSMWMNGRDIRAEKMDVYLKGCVRINGLSDFHLEMQVKGCEPGHLIIDSRPHCLSSKYTRAS